MTMTFEKSHLRHLALLAAWALALSFSISACDEEGEETEDDCALTDSCDPGNTGGNSGNTGGNSGNTGGNSGNTGNNTGESSQWPAVDSSSYRAVYDFIPNGVFAIKTASGDKARFVAKNLDGSLITADVNWNEESDNYKTVSNWKIWHEEMYYWVGHDLIGEKDNKIDRWYTTSLRHPDSSAATPKELRIDSPWGGWDTGFVGDANPLMFYYNFAAFVNNGNKDEAVFEKNDVVAGIPCKKYTYATEGFGFTTKREWWVLDNGFCIKSNFYMDDKLEGVQSFEVVLAELDTESYDVVTQKYARFRNQIKDEIPPVAEMIKAAEGVAGGEWIAPASYIPWTAGGIDFMVNFRALNWEGYPVSDVHVKFKEGTDLKDATEAYKVEIMNLSSMRELQDSGCSTGADYDLGCIWKYDNQTGECGDGYGYFTYKIHTQGAGGEGMQMTPSTPSEIFIRFTRVGCV